jgi:glycosyltransferase involved in cell wall biosynthesis
VTPVAHPSAPTLPEPLYVEVTALLYPHLTGIGRFVARLVEALSAIVPLRLVTAVEGDMAPRVKLSKALPHGWEIALPPGELPSSDGLDVEAWAHALLRSPRRQHDFAQAARSAMLYTWLRPPVRHFRRELCVLYDFTVPLMPWAHQPLTREYFGAFHAHGIRACDAALAISHSTRFDAGWLSPLPSEDVVVAYPGPSLCPRVHASPVATTRRDDLVLAVSALEPRKNGPLLVDWFLTTEALAPACELWWAGPSGWLQDTLTKRERLRRGRREVRFLGQVSDRLLCELYRRASFTIYPSLYEGFGFPVLDSLLHGTPALTSFNSSLQEFVGRGVYYADPCDPTSLDEACHELRASLPLQVDRPDLRETCSWEALARTVLALAE